MSSVWAMFGIEVHSNSDAPVTPAVSPAKVLTRIHRSIPSIVWAPHVFDLDGG